MRRPLWMVCLCLVAFRALLYFAGGPPLNDLPDKAAISVAGHICQKEDNSFYLKIQEIAAGSRQQNPNQSTNQETNQMSGQGAEQASGQTSGQAAMQASEQASGQAAMQASEQASDPDAGQIRFWAQQKVICEYEDAENLRLGSFVVLRGSLETFPVATNPGEFDSAKYYRSIGIAGRIRNVEILSKSEKYSRVSEFLYRLKDYWQRRLYRIFPEKEASVMTAVLLGDKSDLDSYTKKLYQNNGVIHILSISGLHITLIGMGLYGLLRRLGAPVCIAALLGGAVLVLYGVMTGLSVSACRAIGMYLLRMLAQLCGRTYDMLTALGVMAVLLVWSRPGYLEYMGFWLSFGSILGVGVLCPALTPTKAESAMGERRYIEGRLRRLAFDAGKRLSDGAVRGLLAGTSITLTTLPLQLWFTYEVPVYSVLLNMLILPFMGALMVFGLIAMLIPGLGFAGTADVLILSGYERICILFEKLPFHTWNPGKPEIWQVILYYVFWLAAVGATDLYRQAQKKGGRPGEQLGRRRAEGEPGRWRFNGFCTPISRLKPGAMILVKAGFLTAAIFVLLMRIPHGERIFFLDVGQGDCICVQRSTGEVYLFDCGSSSRSRVGERVLIPFLKYYGIRHVDGIFLSHPDSDHASGLQELFALGRQESITIGQVVLPGIAEEAREEEFGGLLDAVRSASQKKAIRIGYVNTGEIQESAGSGPCLGRWRNGGRDSAVKFICLHPAADFPANNSNAYSACFYMELEGGFSMLLTGDVEGKGEAALCRELERRGIERITVLKTAHHGSRNSTSEEFLEQASPALAIISCGRRNRYGHPHGETLERLQEAGATVFRTDESGAITLMIRKHRVKVKLFCREGGV